MDVQFYICKYFCLEKSSTDIKRIQLYFFLLTPFLTVLTILTVLSNLLYTLYPIYNMAYINNN